ncbi:MAG: hypothetical protein ABJA80_13150 [bacterium]
MNRKKAATIAGLALLSVLSTSNAATAQDATTHYPRMAPVEQYLMDRTAEVALARTAAPASISRHAEIMVLGRRGFETAIKGMNGFVCIVDRSWSSAPDPDFWNPKVRVPMCDNAPAARSHLLRITRRAELILAGRTKAQTDETIAAAVGTKELPAMEAGAMSYMMSKHGYAGDSGKHWPSHIMLFYSQTDPAIWGAGLPDSPVFAVNDTVEHVTTFAVALGRWSNGSKER